MMEMIKSLELKRVLIRIKTELTNRWYDIEQASSVSLERVQVHAGRKLGHGHHLAALGQVAQQRHH